MWQEKKPKNKRLWNVGVCATKGRRNRMEDAHIIVDPFPVPVLSSLPLSLHIATDSLVDSLLVAVFDGHNGDRCARFLEENFTRTLKKNIKGLDAADLKQAMEATFEELDQEWLQTQSYEDGSTAISVFIYNEWLTVAHVGDSRAILSNNSVITLSIDHKPTKPNEYDRILKAGGSVIGGRLFGTLDVSRSFGDKPLKTPESGLICEPEIKYEPLTAESSYLVVGCDGLYEGFESDEIIKFLMQNDDGRKSTDDLAKLLVEEALERGSEDNVTAIVIKFDKKQLKKKLKKDSSFLRAKVKELKEKKNHPATAALTRAPSNKRVMKEISTPNEDSLSRLKRSSSSHAILRSSKSSPELGLVPNGQTVTTPNASISNSKFNKRINFLPTEKYEAPPLPSPLSKTVGSPPPVFYLETEFVRTLSTDKFNLSPKLHRTDKPTITDSTGTPPKAVKNKLSHPKSKSSASSPSSALSSNRSGNTSPVNSPPLSPNSRPPPRPSSPPRGHFSSPISATNYTGFVSQAEQMRNLHPKEKDKKKSGAVDKKANFNQASPRPLCFSRSCDNLIPPGIAKEKQSDSKETTPARPHSSNNIS